MQINNLGGARMPVTTSANSTSQTARASFGTLVQSGAGAPMAGRVAIPGSSIVSKAISVNSGAAPGSTFGAPYLQAQTAGAATTGTQMSKADQNKALVDLMKMSLMSFASGTFSMGQSRPGIEALED
ncbi:MAG: hypothetical protein ACJ8AT_28490 [Hyalangium sp.]|uniref:hypothetical protein n=1 Tax=Hyalangium sp. TaxID=2028555 RepID=UPI0038998565